MRVMFWTMVAAILYAYGGYTLAIMLLSLVIRRPVRRDDGYEPPVTFLIAAYNEERDIAAKLDNTLALDYPADKLEIMVASDGSTDGTDEIVRSYAARHPQVRLVRVEGRVGKTETQNQAVEQASGDVVVFSDATTEYQADAVRKLVRNYADPAVGAVSGKYKYREGEGSSMGLATVLFWNYENLIKSRQTRIRTVTGCSGCIYSVRRSAYERLPHQFTSDLVEPLRVLAAGHRIVFEPEALAFEDPTERSGDEFRMRVRVITQGMAGVWYMRSLLNPLRHGFVAFQLWSHKISRWLVPLFLIGLYGVSTALFLVGAGWIYTAAFVAQSVFYLMALAGFVADRLGVRFRILSLPLYFCVLNLASLIGLVNLIRGERMALWEPLRP